MADISTELARILSAIYGEDVRGSIHDAIEKINDVSEVVLTTGTAVTSPSSSSTGFYDDSLYLNTDTFELWKCTGVNTWASQGILKGEAGDDGNGIVSIAKTATSGLVDTYTITYTDGTTSTFDVTNGEDGVNGNKWYRGTGISGKAALPTVYTGSGVADANSGDMFLNPSEGAVYSCVTGGVPTVATWQYEMTLSGGSGGTSDYLDLTNKPSINGHTLLGNQTGADLGLANSSDIPTVDQTYNATSSNAQSGKAVASAISEKIDTSLLKSTVGWTGKNLLPYPYKDTAKLFNGVTYVYNSDNSITVNGTATSTSWTTLLEDFSSLEPNERYILSGCPSGGSESSYSIRLTYNDDTEKSYKDYGDGLEFINTNNLVRIQVIVANGYTANNLTFYPMLRDASITDDTYEPYHESVEEEIQGIYDFNAKTGVHQYLTYPYVDTTRTVTDITFTDIGDGTIKINGNKSTSGNEVFRLFMRDSSTGQPQLILPAGNYKLCKDITTSGISMTVAYTSSGSGVVLATLTDSSKEVEFTVTDSMGKLTVQVNVGRGNYSDVIIKPLIKLAEDKSNLVTPYAMTNRELTEEIATIPTVNNGQLTIQHNGTNKATFTANQSGNATANIVTDDWVATGTVSNGAVSFSGIDDSGNYAYKPFAEVTASSTNKNPTAQISTLSGTGTSSMSVTYTTDADNGTTVKLRRIK